MIVALAALVFVTSALAASALHVSSRSWEIGQGGTIHKVAASGKFSYCASQPVTGLTPTIAYTHAPAGKSYTAKMAGPSASGTIPPGVKIRFPKSTGRVSSTYATPSFPGHQIAAGKYTFSMRIGAKTVATLKLTLAARAGC